MIYAVHHLHQRRTVGAQTIIVKQIKLGDAAAEKVRQHDSTSSISLGTLEDAPALELSESIGGVSYITYIYEDENALKELFVQASQPVTKSQGETILAIQNFSIEQAGENLLRFTVTDEENTSASLFIHIRSHSTGTKGGAS